MMAERDSASITLSLREGGHQWIRALTWGWETSKTWLEGQPSYTRRTGPEAASIWHYAMVEDVVEHGPGAYRTDQTTFWCAMTNRCGIAGACLIEPRARGAW